MTQGTLPYFQLSWFGASSMRSTAKKSYNGYLINWLNKLYANNDRMAQLIEDLLNVTRIESGKLEFKFSKFHIEDICREVVESLILKAKGLDLYLNYERPKEPLPELMRSMA